MSMKIASNSRRSSNFSWLHNVKTLYVGGLNCILKYPHYSSKDLIEFGLLTVVLGLGLKTPFTKIFKRISKLFGWLCQVMMMSLQCQWQCTFKFPWCQFIIVFQFVVPATPLGSTLLCRYTSGIESRTPLCRHRTNQHLYWWFRC